MVRKNIMYWTKNAELEDEEVYDSWSESSVEEERQQQPDLE